MIKIKFQNFKRLSIFFFISENEDLSILQRNLKKVFNYYLKIDPNPPKHLNVDYSRRMLSVEGLLKFCYNYNIIDRFLKRKSLAQILSNFGDYLRFDHFLASFLNNSEVFKINGRRYVSLYRNNNSNK